MLSARLDGEVGPKIAVQSDPKILCNRLHNDPVLLTFQFGHTHVHSRCSTNKGAYQRRGRPATQVRLSGVFFLRGGGSVSHEDDNN